jgi:hypothetical protein
MNTLQHERTLPPIPSAASVAVCRLGMAWGFYLLTACGAVATLTEAMGNSPRADKQLQSCGRFPQSGHNEPVSLRYRKRDCRAPHLQCRAAREFSRNGRPRSIRRTPATVASGCEQNPYVRVQKPQSRIGQYKTLRLAAGAKFLPRRVSYGKLGSSLKTIHSHDRGEYPKWQGKGYAHNNGGRCDATL